MVRLDTFVVGQGLAGTTLAWALLLRGASVRVLDGAYSPAASRAAAGLLAPVGGRRLAVAWRAEQAWPAALEFYRRIERELGVRLLSESPFVRLFTDAQQRREFHRRLAGPLRAWSDGAEPGVDGDVFSASFGGCLVRGARLDVAHYLDASREAFRRRGLLVEADLDDAELVESASGVTLRRHGLTARHAVLCRGLAEPLATGLPFEPAKGEVLTITAAGVEEKRVVQRGVWMAPAGEHRYRVGATFDRVRLDSEPTSAGRAELEGKLRAMLLAPYEVVDHVAGVRPIVGSRRPVVGPLPGREHVGVFNGLGASGTLWAPWAAACYAAYLLSGSPLDKEIDARRRLAGR